MSYENQLMSGAAPCPAVLSCGNGFDGALGALFPVHAHELSALR
jgi:hypothetical protein